MGNTESHSSERTISDSAQADDTAGKSDRQRTSLNDLLQEERMQEQKAGDSPTITITSVAFSSVDLDQALMEVEVEICNPGKADINLLSMDIALQTGETLFLNVDQHPLEAPIKPKYSELFNITLTISYETILDLIPEIKRGQVILCTLKLWPNYKESLQGVPSLYAEKQVKVPIPLEPTVELERARLFELSMEELSLKIRVRVRNENEFNMSVARIEYRVLLSGETVVSGSTSPKTVVRSNSFKVAEFAVSFWPKNLLAALFTIARGRGRGFKAEWKLHAFTSFGAMEL